MPHSTPEGRECVCVCVCVYMCACTSPVSLSHSGHSDTLTEQVVKIPSTPWMKENWKPCLIPCHSYQEHCKCETRQAEWNFINNTIQDGLKGSNTKPFWNRIKASRRENTSVSPLKGGGWLHSDSATKATILFRQFKSIFTKSTRNPPPSSLTTETNPSQELKISTADVAKLSKRIETLYGTGPSRIPNTLLKTCIVSIAPAISMIFQKSLHTGRQPADW